MCACMCVFLRAINQIVSLFSLIMLCLTLFYVFPGAEGYKGKISVRYPWRQDLPDNHHGGCISSDGLLLASSSEGKVLLWDADTGDKVATYEGHTDDITRMCFSCDRAFVCTVSKDRTARVWHLPSRTLRPISPTTDDVT